jgi:8-oxo-dGTP pyrophosphatase MutT (NUDIX family)
LDAHLIVKDSGVRRCAHGSSIRTNLVRSSAIRRLIIRNPDQYVLLGLRTNEPAKGKWFVPGGVVRKYERLADAFARIVKAEIGLEASIGDAKFVGVYEHLYDSTDFIT